MRPITVTTSKPSSLHKTLFALMIFLLISLIQSPSEAQEPPDQTPESQPPGKMPEFLPVDPLIPFARRWDINGDHVSTCEEWKLFTIRVFHKADWNRDKVLDESEMSDVTTADVIFFDSSLSYFDTNNDGVVGRAEFVDRPNPFFSTYDADKDCRVTEREQSTSGK